jgi:hypothetical protein
MVEVAPNSPMSKEAAIQKLADDLRTETLPATILADLKALDSALNNEVVGDKLALVFLHACGLPTLIQHLGGSVTSAGTTDADAMASAIPGAAAVALSRIFNMVQDRGALLVELQSIPGVIATLTAVFRDARLPARFFALTTLSMLATAQPTECKGMVEGGVVELVLKYFFDVGAMPGDTLLPTAAVELACVLLTTLPAAAWHFAQAIRAPGPVQAFAAVVLVQVCHSCRIVLVRCTTMPFCVALFRSLDQEIQSYGIATARLSFKHSVSRSGDRAALSALSETGSGYGPCLQNLLMGLLVHQILQRNQWAICQNTFLPKLPC